MNYSSIIHPEPNTPSQKEKNYKKQIYDKINEIKDQPNLLAWYVNDEKPYEYNREIRNISLTIHELDPHHPTYSVIQPYGEMPFLLNTTDIMGVDTYPIGIRQIREVHYLTSQEAENALGKPMIPVVQIFDWSIYNNTSTGKSVVPTLQEMRSMSWQQLVLGAKGLMFYSLLEIIQMNETTPIKERWKDIITLTDEIWKYKDVFLSVDKVNKIEYVQNYNVTFGQWKHNNINYIAIVNLEREKETFKINLLEQYIIHKEFGLGTFKVNGNEINFNLEPIDVILIKLIKNSSNNTLIIFIVIILIIILVVVLIFFVKRYLDKKYKTKIFVNSVSKLMDD